MANLEHLALLGSGVEVWNTWRYEHKEIVPDLQEADLWGTELAGAYLSGANLTGARLGCADLTGAHLHSARLIRTDLRSATLAGSHLMMAQLIRASLEQTDFSRALFGWTILSFLDLSTARGLNSVFHDAPSSIDVETFVLSNGMIDAEFLRGIGTPDSFLTYAKSLSGKPIEFYSCFISYSTKDTELAERLYTDLQSRGVRCWYAREDLKIGEEFQERIEESIRLHDKLLLVLSENSVNSRWVEREVQAAREREDRDGKLVLFPVRLDDAVMLTPKAWAADLRRTRHIGDFRRWKDYDSYQSGLARLFRDLTAVSSPTKE
jgi:hypothetical protein